MFTYTQVFKVLLRFTIFYLLLWQFPEAYSQEALQIDSVSERSNANTLLNRTVNFSDSVSNTLNSSDTDSTGGLFPDFSRADDSQPVSPVTENIYSSDSLSRTNNRLGGFRDEITQAPDIRQIISFSKVFWSIIFIIIGYFLIKAISGILEVVSERKVKYKGAIRRILPIIRIVGWSLVVYIIINGIFQPPAETIFAFFASVGVAIGFASQDLLKNIFGGLMILFDKPFQIGDKIESGKYYGEVMEIGLRSTRIVTPDDSVVTIPNSEMMNQSISNANSGENNCQVVAEFYFPVTIDTKRVRQIAVEAAQISQYVYLNKPILVVFSNVINQRGTLLKMKLKAYVNDVRYEFSFQSEMTEIVFREMNKEGLLNGL